MLILISLQLLWIFGLFLSLQSLNLFYLDFFINWAYIAGFFLFRLFDIVKPQPAKWADQKVLNAWGVMLDDVFAGIYAGLFLLLINFYIVS